MRYWLWIPVLLAVSAPASASPYNGTQTFDIKQIGRAHV